MKKCPNCLKEAPTEKRCKQCGKFICNSCWATSQLCKECYLIQNDKFLVAEYFADKYASKIKPFVTGMLLLLFLFLLSVPGASAWDAQEFENTAKVNYSVLWKGAVLNSEGIILLAKDNCTGGNFTSAMNTTCYDNLCVRLLSGNYCNDEHNLDFYDSGTNTSLKWQKINYTGLANWSLTEGLTNNVSFDAVRVWGINQSTNVSIVSISYNTTSGTVDNSDDNTDLVGWWEFERSLISAGQLRDYSGNGKTVNIVDTTVYVQDSRCLHGSNFSSTGCYLFSNSRFNISSTGFPSNGSTVAFWFSSTNITSSTNQYIGDIGTAATSANWIQLYDTDTDGHLNFRIGTFAGAGSYKDSTFELEDTNWHHVAIVTYLNKTLELYIDGVLDFSLTVTSLGTNGINIVIGTDITGAYDFKGYLDSLMLFNRTLTATDIWGLYGRGVHVPLEFYDAGIDSSISSGLLVNWVERTNQSVGQNELFRYWVNWTFTNLTAISNSSGWCNYTTTNVSSLEQKSTGGNFSLCSDVLCDYSPTYLETFTSVKLIPGYQYDVFTFQLCRDGNIGTLATVRTNCSADIQVLTNGDMPLCSAGYVNFSIKNTWCNDKSDFIINVTNDNIYAKRIVLINRSIVLDRFLNPAANLTWNVTKQLWTNGEFTHYTMGNRTVYFSCYYSAGGVDNQTTSLNYAVQNANPSVTFSSIEDWFNGLRSFTNNIVMKWPLVGNINITGGCVDTNRDTTIFYLNYSNGTNIYTHIETASTFSESLIPGNFTMNALRVAQVWCNDTSGLTSSITRTFNTSNKFPVSGWVNASGQTFSTVPLIFNMSCVDEEDDFSGITKQHWFWFNGTLNQSSITVPSVLFNSTVGYWNVTGMCSDGTLFSDNSSLFFTYQLSCDMDIFGVDNGQRYLSTVLPVNMNCSNGIAGTCYWRTNYYAWNTITNCSSFNITLETGKNDVDFMIEDKFNTTTSYTVYAKDSNLTIWGLVLFWVYLMVYFLCIIMGRWSGMGAMYALSIVPAFLLGFEVVAISLLGGAFIMSILSLASIALILRNVA